MRFRHSGIGIVFMLLCILFGLFWAIAAAAYGGKPEPDVFLPVLAVSTVFAVIFTLGLRVLMVMRFGEARTKRIERCADTVFLITVFVPCLIWTVWQLLHAV